MIANGRDHKPEGVVGSRLPQVTGWADACKTTCTNVCTTSSWTVGNGCWRDRSCGPDVSSCHLILEVDTAAVWHHATQGRPVSKTRIEVLPVSDKAYRIKVRQNLINDLTENLWSEIAVVKNGKLVLDDDGEPKRIKVAPQHYLINKILDSIQNELDPIKVNVDHTVHQQLEIAREKAINIAKEICEN